jgi:hypothetical protein
VRKSQWPTISQTQGRIAPSSVAFSKAVQAALHPSPVTGRAEARVDEHRVVERRPLDRRAAPAEPARVGPLPLAGATRRREFPLVGVGEGAEGADGGGGRGGEEEEAAAEVRRGAPGRLQLPPRAGVASAAAELHGRAERGSPLARSLPGRTSSGRDVSRRFT